LRSLGRREPGQHILDVFKRIDAKTLASFDDTHDGGSGVTTFFRASKEPVAPAEHHGLDAAFTGVVADFNEGMVEVNQKSRPTIESIRDCFAKFCLWQYDKLRFIEAVFEESDFRLCQSLAQIFAFRFRERCRHSLNVKETFDHSHGKFCRYWIGFPSVFEIAMYMRPAICGSSTILNDVVELVGPVSLKDAGVAFKNFLRIDGALGVRIIVEDVGMVSIATVDPNTSPVRFSKSLFDNWKSGGIRLKNTTVQDELAHSFDNRMKNVSDFFQPSTHGGPIYGNAQSFEHLLLAVKRQVQPEFVGGNFGKKPRTGQAFINWLVGLLSGDDLPGTVLAGVFKHDVLDIFEERKDEFNLVRDIKADYFSGLPTARARNFAGVNTMFDFARCKMRGWSGASATMFWIADYVQSIFLGIKFIGSLKVNGFSCAGQQSSIDFGRLLTKGCAVAAAKLFFEYGDAFLQRLNFVAQVGNELVAFRNVIRQIVGVGIGWRFSFGHVLAPVVTTPLYDATTSSGIHC